MSTSAAGIRSMVGIGAGVCASLLAACATTPRVSETQVQAYLADKPAALHGHYRDVVVEGPRNQVLNQMETGLAAMEIGELDAAAASFDDALAGIETVYANSESADKARSMWREEGSKDFKGEPYERAMAYYYRGLLYLEAGDYENARASFREGAFQDVAGENSEYAQDVALLEALSGFASQCNGEPDKAREAYEEAARLRAGFVAPASGDNVLVVAETGRAPQKIKDGPGGSWLRFQHGGVTEDQRVQVSVGGNAVEAFPIEDTFFQASTRGGRPVEVVLEGKAKFKEDMDTLGDVALATGAATVTAGSMAGSSEAQLAGAAIMLMGLAAKGVSNAVKPEADVRTWTSLPGQVHLASFRTAAPSTPVELNFLGSDGQPIESLRHEGRVQGGSASCRVLWVRSGSADGSMVARRAMGIEVAQSGGQQ
jgi:tetratricopeptide (TPR) repeat protein